MADLWSTTNRMVNKSRAELLEQILEARKRRRIQDIVRRERATTVKPPRGVKAKQRLEKQLNDLSIDQLQELLALTQKRGNASDYSSR